MLYKKSAPRKQQNEPVSTENGGLFHPAMCTECCPDGQDPVIKHDIKSENHQEPSLAASASQNTQERKQIVVIREQTIVVEIDVIACARAAFAACEHNEEVNEVVIVWEECVVVEVDGVAAWCCLRDFEHGDSSAEAAHPEFVAIWKDAHFEFFHTCVWKASPLRAWVAIGTDVERIAVVALDTCVGGAVVAPIEGLLRVRDGGAHKQREEEER